AEDGVDRVEQLAHHRDVDLQWLFASLAKTGSVRSYSWLEAAGHACRQIECRAKVLVASLRDPRWRSYRRARLELSGIQAGMRDPLPVGHVRGQNGQLRKDGNRADLADAFDCKQQLIAPCQNRLRLDQSECRGTEL